MANNRKRGNPAGAIFALLMLIVIVVALVIVLRSCQGPGGEGASSPSANPGEVSTNVEQPSGESGGDITDPTAGATNTPVPPTSTPATPSPTPVPPTPTPLPSASGSIRSNTGTGLNIVADWSLNGSTLTVSVDAESYSLYSQRAWHGCSVTVGGQTYYIDTEPIEYDGAALATHPLGSVTISGVSRGAQLEVSWHFQGTYGGTALDSITASGAIA